MTARSTQWMVAAMIAASSLTGRARQTRRQVDVESNPYSSAEITPWGMASKAGLSHKKFLTEEKNAKGAGLS